MENFDDLKFIFFVSFTDKLPRYYYELAKAFKKQDLTLIPIRLDQLTTFHQGRKRVHVLTVVSNIREKRMFLKASRSLRPAISNQLVTLYHMCSFQELNYQIKYGKMKNYHFIQLPVRYEALTEIVYKRYTEEIQNSARWLGGRRAKLPKDVDKL
ncbi:MAG: hypothetical protein JNM93_05435 [Bacteriovoracaceae bacterium]|nr:hypothetical protein [Bacteriovoracaceae bacterium]